MNCSSSRRKIMAVICTSVIFLVIVITIPTVVLSGKDNNQKPLKVSTLNSTESTVVIKPKGNKQKLEKPLRVGAFNIRKFGKSKMSKLKVAHDIDLILQRYDILLIIEVMDLSQKSIHDLLKILQTTNKSWKYVSSDRMGRTSYKEQYVFYYKSDTVIVEDKYQVPDIEDVFEREPFAINIKYKSVSHGENRWVALAGIHIKPSDALVELEALPAAIEEISNNFNNIDGVIVMGDYNADCSYLPKKHQRSLPILTSNKYRNLISNSMDTSVAKGDCAYDRITIYGPQIDTRAANIYRFDKELNLNTEEAFSVSDHYPVEFLLY